MPALLWDVYCRVIDNLGDAGVCWRLAVNLAQRGQRVRLFIDDATPLAFMAPAGVAGVDVLAWPGAGAGAGAEPGDVVIEAFGCDLHPATVAAMAARPLPPVWLNLEYLSAEAYVERSHGLLSPQANGLQKWFFYPGYTAPTGGLLREVGLAAAQAAFDRDAWLQAQGLTRQAGERVVALFCYDNPALPALLQQPDRRPHTAAADAGPGAAAGGQRAARRAPAPPALADTERFRRTAVDGRPELRARRGLAGACAVGRRALRLAGLPAARRRPCGQAAGPDRTTATAARCGQRCGRPGMACTAAGQDCRRHALRLGAPGRPRRWPRASSSGRRPISPPSCWRLCATSKPPPARIRGFAHREHAQQPLGTGAQSSLNRRTGNSTLA